MLIKNEFVCDETGKLSGNNTSSMCTKWHFATVNVGGVGVGAVARKLLDADKLVNNVILFLLVLQSTCGKLCERVRLLHKHS